MAIAPKVSFLALLRTHTGGHQQSLVNGVSRAPDLRTGKVSLRPKPKATFVNSRGRLSSKRRNVRQILALQGFAGRSWALLKAFEVPMLKPPPFNLVRALCPEDSWPVGAGPAAGPTTRARLLGGLAAVATGQRSTLDAPDTRQRIRLQPSTRPKKRRLRSQACCAHTGSYWVIGMRPGPTAVSLAKPCWAK